MLKRLAILGLVLLFAGSASLGWVLAENKKEQQQIAQYQSKYPDKSELVLDEQGGIKTKAQLRQEQQIRLKADMDKLAGGQADSTEAAAKAGSDARALADFLYGENWQDELKKYKGRQEKKELIFNSSIVCMSIGGTIFSGCLLLYTIRLVIKVSSRLGKNEPQLAPAPFDKLRAGSVAGAASATGAEAKEVQVAPQLDDCPEAAAKAGQDSFRSIGIQSAQSRLALGAEQSKKPARLAGGSLKTLFDVSKQYRLNRDGAKSTPYFESPNPLNNTLMDLAQQVAAIREYASNQQDRVQKLQEGYDWNIIRNFCLRIIRCIDNVENRVRERAGRNGEAVHLREIRDELLFALESSGIEQFEPEVNSDYRGQEKHIEAVKERESCDDPDLAGKIARVIRPGYQYFVDDKHVKIVRPAMVMLWQLKTQN